MRIAFAYREDYPGLFECITGCMFFGTPFGGADAAKAAMMYAQIANDQANAHLYTSLLDFLTPGNQARDLDRTEFEHISARMSRNIQVICVWELGAVVHERAAWTRYLRTDRDRAAKIAYLEDRFSGPA